MATLLDLPNELLIKILSFLIHGSTFRSQKSIVMHPLLAIASTCPHLLYLTRNEISAYGILNETFSSNETKIQIKNSFLATVLFSRPFFFDVTHAIGPNKSKALKLALLDFILSNNDGRKLRLHYQSNKLFLKKIFREKQNDLYDHQINIILNHIVLYRENSRLYFGLSSRTCCELLNFLLLKKIPNLQKTVKNEIRSDAFFFYLAFYA